jgi:hypothetical protein
VVVLGVTTVEPEIPDAVKPAPVQDVALIEFHERVDDCPAFTDVGLAESDTVGGVGGAAPTEAACKWIPVRAALTNTR